MSSRPASNEELQRMHPEVLLGIVNDFLCWGGAPQAAKAESAVHEVLRRVEERKRAVRHDDKLLAVI